MALSNFIRKESSCLLQQRALSGPRLARCSLSRPRTAQCVCRAHADRRSSHVAKAPLRLSDAAVGACALASATLACLGWGDGVLAAAVVPDSNPYVEGKTIRLGVTADETIRACPGNVNPNCVSTASTNELYAPAWRAKTKNALEAAEAIERTFLALYPDSELAQSATYGYGEYRAFVVPSLFGKDVVEFLIKNESVNNRNWEGDSEGPFVTYRSLAGSVKYVWPIQQPISDFGAQKARMAAIREQLGWQVIGCELIECYEY